MKKLSNFLVEKRLWLFIASTIAAIVCIFLMNFVTVNEDMSKYLPKDSSMRTGLTIMENQFPTSTQEESFKLMFEDLSDADKQALMTKISGFEGVTSVDYQADSEEYNSGKYTLFIVNTNLKDVDKTDALVDKITANLEKDYTVYAYYANTEDSVLGVLLPTALALFLS